MRWRLGRDEAVLLIGRTPPRAKYWSITPYVMSQYYAHGKHPRTKQGTRFSSWIQRLAVSCHPSTGGAHGDRCQKFASLDQPFNYKEGGFGLPFAVVFTASRTTHAAVKAAINSHLRNEGVPLSSIPLRLLAIPADLINLGTDSDERDEKTRKRANKSIIKSRRNTLNEALTEL